MVLLYLKVWWHVAVLFVSYFLLLYNSFMQLSILYSLLFSSKVGLYLPASWVDQSTLKWPTPCPSELCRTYWSMPHPSIPDEIRPILLNTTAPFWALFLLMSYAVYPTEYAVPFSNTLCNLFQLGNTKTVCLVINLRINLSVFRWLDWCWTFGLLQVPSRGCEPLLGGGPG